MYVIQFLGVQLDELEKLRQALCNMDPYNLAE